MGKLAVVLASLAIGAAAPCSTVRAQEGADALAKKLANPVASLISVPFQYNIDFNVGSADGTQHKLNIQPVIPTSISEHWNVITRVIMPVIYQDDVAGHSGTQFGLGDTTPSFFLSPKEPTSRGWIFGAGPVFLLPTATDNRLGGQKWGSARPPWLCGRRRRGGPTGSSPITSGRWPVAAREARSAARLCSPSLPSSFRGHGRSR
jgi:hypothetical protein